jgi:hypothetical protein
METEDWMAHGTPRRLRMNRAGRLRSAKKWLAAYRGRDVVRGYRKWYGVSRVCAILELRMLGVAIDDQRLAQARLDEANLARQRAQRRQTVRGIDRFWECEHLWDPEIPVWSEDDTDPEPGIPF